MVRVPVRGWALTLPVKRYSTLPLPIPVDPDEIVIHGALLAAVQLHALVVDTLTAPEPSFTSAGAVVAKSEYAQADGSGGDGGDGGGGDGGDGAGPTSAA